MPSGCSRADVFAQGYGEENDFCLRARHLGWRHVAVPGVFVAHVGGQSFGGAARHLRARNAALLERLHPGYMRLIETYAGAEPLAEAKRRLDLARWRTMRRRGVAAAILITHAEGGGVERQVSVSAGRHQAAGRRVIVLRPASSPDGGKGVCICEGMANEFPNLRYALPDELPAVHRLLAAEHPREVELHHMVNHHPAILDLMRGLGVPHDVHMHDHAWLCGRIALVGPENRYCGEPEVICCEECVADAGNPDRRGHQRRGRCRGAHGWIVRRGCGMWSRRRRTRRRGSGATFRQSTRSLCRMRMTRRSLNRCGRSLSRVVAVSAWWAPSAHKGYQVVLNCARNAAERDLPLEFFVVGPTIDDARLLATGRVFVTGRFEPEEAVPLIKAQGASLALLPSIFPETWCLSLAEAWRAGLQVAAFDIGGAQAERIRRTGRGFALAAGPVCVRGDQQRPDCGGGTVAYAR